MPRAADRPWPVPNKRPPPGGTSISRNIVQIGGRPCRPHSNSRPGHRFPAGKNANREFFLRVKTALRLFLLLLGSSVAALCGAPPPRAESPVGWTIETSRPPVVGEEVDLVIRARIAPRWTVYSSDFKGQLGPQPTEFQFSPHASFQLIGTITPIGAKPARDKTWETDYAYFSERAEFRQRVKVLALPLAGSVRIKGQLCNEHEGTCSLLNEHLTW